jgi:hypothetical protein
MSDQKKTYGATVCMAIYVEADNKDEAAKLVLNDARIRGISDPWIINIEEEEL